MCAYNYGETKWSLVLHCWVCVQNTLSKVEKTEVIDWGRSNVCACFQAGSYFDIDAQGNSSGTERCMYCG